MPLYHKRPTIVEAFQMTEESRADISSWPLWLYEAWDEGVMFLDSQVLCLITREGSCRVRPCDWIVKGDKCGLVLHTPEVFESKYERVEE